MVTILIVLAVLGWIGGSLLLQPATYGVGALAAACLLAILARIAQAGTQHREMTRLMRAGLGMTDPAAPASPTPGAWTCTHCQSPHGAGLFDCPGCGAARPAAIR